MRHEAHVVAALTAVLAAAVPAPRFQGVIVPMVTPFDASGSHVDLAAMRRHTIWLLDKPVAILFPISGLGQWRSLALEEKKKAIIREVVKASGGRKPVVPGITSSHSFAETVYDAQADVTPETLSRLAQASNIKAIKYRTKDIERFLRMVHAAGDRVAVLAGVEHMGVAALAAGATGIVGGGANVFPQMIDAAFQRFRAGDLAASRRATFALIDANDGVPGSQEIKYALARYYGLPMSQSGRGSLEVPLTIAEKDHVDAAMQLADPVLGAARTPLALLTRELAAKRARYLGLAVTAHDPDGFVHSKCDGTTFTSLSCIARGLDQRDCPAYKARDAQEPGLWFRHAQHDCFEHDGGPGGSQSDNSPDVFTMLALIFWHYRDLASVSAIISYGEHHGWIMGRARVGAAADTVAWNDDLKALYYELRFRLGGADDPARRALLRPAPIGSGWSAHVAVNRLLLVALMTGEMKAAEVAALHALGATEPHNALYQALLARLADGDPRSAYELLVDETHFPATTLPNSRRNHCEEYLFQRDERDGARINPDWLPCPGEPVHVHSGTDFLWASCVLTPGCLVTSPVPLSMSLQTWAN